MADLGDRTLTAYMQMQKELIRAFSDLMKQLFSVDSKLKREQLKQMRTKNELDYMKSQSGLVSMKTLQSQGEQLFGLPVKMAPQDVRRMETLAKFYGVQFAKAVDKQVLENIRQTKAEIRDIEAAFHDFAKLTSEDQKRLEVLRDRLEKLQSEKAQMMVMIKYKDKKVFKDILDRMNVEKRLDEIDKRIEELENKKDRTQDEDKELDSLKQEKEGLNKTLDKVFNAHMDESFMENVNDETGKEIEPLSYDRAMANAIDIRHTGEPVYIVDAEKLDNYIEARTTYEEKYNDKGEDRLNTHFILYKEEAGVASVVTEANNYTRPKTGEHTSSAGERFWERMKEDFRKKAEMGSMVYIFHDKKEMDNFRSEVSKRLEEERKEVESVTHSEEIVIAEPVNIESSISIEASADSYKDYSQIINTLKSQLANHNMMINAKNEILSKTTGNPIKFSSKDFRFDDEMQDVQSTVQGILIAKETIKIQQMQKLQDEMQTTFKVYEDMLKKNNSADVRKIYEDKKKEYREEMKSLEMDLEKILWEKAYGRYVQDKKQDATQDIVIDNEYVRSYAEKVIEDNKALTDSINEHDNERHIGRDATLEDFNSYFEKRQGSVDNSVSRASERVDEQINHERG